MIQAGRQGVSLSIYGTRGVLPLACTLVPIVQLQARFVHPPGQTSFVVLNDHREGLAEASDRRAGRRPRFDGERLTQEGGANFVSRIDVLAWLLASVFLTVATLAMRNRAMWFFFLLAAVPWGLSLGISAAGDRPIFHERYLIFAQVFLLGLWGLLCSTVWQV